MVLKNAKYYVCLCSERRYYNKENTIRAVMSGIPIYHCHFVLSRLKINVEKYLLLPVLQFINMIQ